MTPEEQRIPVTMMGICRRCDPPHIQSEKKANYLHPEVKAGTFFLMGEPKVRQDSRLVQSAVSLSGLQRNMIISLLALPLLTTPSAAQQPRATGDTRRRRQRFITEPGLQQALCSSVHIVTICDIFILLS